MRFAKVATPVFLALWLLVSPAIAEMIVVPVSDDMGNLIELKAELLKPDGDGPFPAVVMMHGGGGLTPHLKTWAARFVEWGYMAIIIDSFGPRGVENIYTDPFLVNFETRADDACAAKACLCEMPQVDKNRVALVGWGHGGSAVIKALIPNSFKDRGDPFCAGVAFYPLCMDSMEQMNAPIMILTGELDDWHFADACKRFEPKEKTEFEVMVNVYPGAHNAFDQEGVKHDIQGHHYEYQKEAAVDSIVRVRDFFEKYMK